jgi:CRP-like cAMP-binding protein
MRTSAPEDNRVLAALPHDERDRVFPHLEPVLLRLGRTLYEGDRLAYVYFPTDAVVSLFYEMKNGASAQTAVIGNDGMIGIAALIGSAVGLVHPAVHVAGRAYRVRGAVLKAEFERHGPVHALVLRYLQVLASQIAQTAACNRYHNIEQQVCRWLLLDLDRLPSNHFRMTQVMMSAALGVRREGVNTAAQRLQRDGIIRYDRARITVIDRAALEARACECYRVLQEELSRSLNPAEVHKPGETTGENRPSSVPFLRFSSI